MRVGYFAGFGFWFEIADLRVGKRHMGGTPLSNQSGPKFGHRFFQMQRENEKRIGKAFHANLLNQRTKDA
ncbi:hypothetical protein GCM10022405_12200 [Gibbsiella dentisursi]|uniref:Uncharacterized protein n=1 Tax=Gibbsiella dentisursi TaxID=796890 RepID=A0ABP7KVT6_9GAMM